MSTSTRRDERPRAGSGRGCSWRWLVPVAAAVWSIGVAGAARGDELVTRPNLTLKNKQIDRFDEDGVRLGPDSRPIAWDEVVSGTLQKDQARFDQLRTTIGEPLHQIRQLMAAGNYGALLEPAQALFPRFADRRSGSAYIVSLARVRARLASHRPEDAIEPYLVCVTLQRTLTDLPPIPGRRRLRNDERTGLCAELPLVGFDRERAAAALARAFARLAALGDAAPEGLRLYVAGLAVSAGDAAAAEAELGAIGSPTPAVAEVALGLRVLVQAQRGQAAKALTRLREIQGTCLHTNKAAIGYLIGTAGLAGDAGEARDAVVDLLSVAVLHGEEQPALAAAALYAAQRAARAAGARTRGAGGSGRAAAFLPGDLSRRAVARRAGAGIGGGARGEEARAGGGESRR